MDTLLHNPIADMYGPYFLLFYGFVIAATLIICRQLVQDPTKNQPLPLIPVEPDPYKIAYLRSQETGVAHVVLFNLIQQGYLQVSEKTISQAPNYPDTDRLKPIESQVFHKFSNPATANTALWLATQCVLPFCNMYEEKLQNEQLLYAAKWQQHNLKVGLIGAMIIFSLGAYKLLIALGKGRYNVGFLILMGVCSIIYLLWFVSQQPRLSHLGSKYLQQLQGTFIRLPKVTNNPSVFNNNLLVVALFGVVSLAGTAYDSYYQALFTPIYPQTSSRSSRSSSSSCGSSYNCSSCSSSSCSSSCSSGSSCGSSCGGGCGGCGGGD